MIITKINFPENQYIKKECTKNQICLHHTVSGGSAKAVANYWNSNKPRIATPYLIDKKGFVFKLFEPQYLAGHIGSSETMTKEFNKFGLQYQDRSINSIGIELISWGGLNIINGKLYNAYGGRFKGKFINYKDGFRGFNYFDMYTTDQLRSLADLIKLLSFNFGISINFDEDIFNLNRRALSGENGLFLHTSYRSDKSDLHPQPELIYTLKNL